MILCGSAHSGKSSAAKLMIDILTQMQQQQQLQSSSSQSQKTFSTSHESNYSLEVASQTHKLYR
jgi:ribosomal protein L31